MNLNIVSAISEYNTNTNKNLKNSLEKLSSGLRINKAADDASGLSIADNLRTHASGIKQSIANANSAIAMMNIADKAMDELSNILDIIKTKSIQMATDTTSQEGRVILKTDILKLIDNYDAIVTQTNYNARPLLQGCEDIVFHVGNNLDDTMTVQINSVKSCDVGKPDPFTLNNFISGFQPTTPITTNLGNPSDGVVLSNDISQTTSYSSNPGGEFMIEIPAGTQDLTLYLNDNGANDTIQVFTKNGEHVSGTSELHTNNLGISTWSGINRPQDVITNNPSRFNAGATYVDNTTLYPLNSPKESLGSSSVPYTDKSGNAQTLNLGPNEEAVVISNVTEDLVVFINGSGSYQVSAEWADTSSPAAGSGVLCACENQPGPREDINPNLKTQAQELMSVIDKALSLLNQERAEVGSTTNQLESTTRNLMTDYVNTKNAEGIIRDVDYAKEASNFNKQNIVGQGGSFAQSKGNETQQRVLDLLQ